VPSDFPFDAVRDLVGLLRGMWAAEKRRSFPSAKRLRALEKAAQELKAAMSTAAVHDAGTAPYERAKATAEAIATRLADLVELTTPMEPVLQVAGERIRKVRRRSTEKVPHWAKGRQRNGGG
jgi:hypothetical protein